MSTGARLGWYCIPFEWENEDGSTTTGTEMVAQDIARGLETSGYIMDALLEQTVLGPEQIISYIAEQLARQLVEVPNP